MHPPYPRQSTITWNVTALKISDDGLETPCCRDCEAPLNVHQPDEDRPEHLLGTCPRCGAWYLIEVGKGTTGAFMFDLPNVALVHAATSPTGSKSSGKRPPKRMAGDTTDFRRTPMVTPRV